MERFRLTILVESRIRWKVYVRFGGEYWETYHRNMTRRRVLSLHNQIVKAVNSHFSNVAIPHQIAMLEQRTRELKALSIEILNLAKQAKEWLRIRPAGTDHRGRSHVTGGVRSHAPKSFTQAKATAKTDYITLNEQAGTFIPACC